jgi:hypothetical protein
MHLLTLVILCIVEFLNSGSKCFFNSNVVYRTRVTLVIALYCCFYITVYMYKRLYSMDFV